MDEKKMKDLLIDYIDGKLTGELKGFIETNIEKNEEIRKEYESLLHVIGLMDQGSEHTPSPAMKEEFMRNLEAEKETADDSKVISLQRNTGIWWKIAASVSILALGFFIGRTTLNIGNDRELQALRQEMEDTKQILQEALANNSASQRIQGINAGNTLNIEDERIQVDPEILEALISTMNHDSNVNVRLAAVNSLKRFSHLSSVRNAFIHSLESQEDAIIQIQLITILVEIGEKRAIEQLKKIVDDEEALPVVKDEAQLGIFRLS